LSIEKMKKFHGPNIRRQPSLSEQVVDYFRKEIEKGNFSPGEALPSEAKLAGMFQVSRTVVREAFSRLKHDGVLEARKGGRTYVSMDTHGQVFRIEDKNVNDDDHLAYLYELRIMIEPEASALAAIRSSAEDKKNIIKKFELLAQALDKGEEVTEQSKNFHLSVLEASGNPYLSKFISWIDNKIWSFIKLSNLKHDREMISEVQYEHLQIYDAIRSGNHKMARDVSRKHVLDAARRHGIKTEFFE
jgi:GntR family transcriptional repressor for pyruvate dehydrogenase complex